MKHLLQIEMKKALWNRYAVVSAALLQLFSLLSADYMIETWVSFNPDGIETYIRNGQFRADPMISMMGFYNAWIGMDSMSLVRNLFYTLLPVLSALPFAWSLHEEKKTGFIRNSIIRSGKKQYYCCKAIAVSLSAMFFSFAALVTNVLAVSAFLPAYIPEPQYIFYSHVMFGNLWADLHFTFPWLRVMGYVLLTSIYCGIFSLLSMSVTFTLNSRLAVIFDPFLLFLALRYIETTFSSHLLSWEMEIVPMNFLTADSEGLFSYGFVIFIEGAMLLLSAIIIIWIRGKHDEIL